MKGYKVFSPDWTCKRKRYAVGEIATQDGRLKMCENGIHFCTELADCFSYYSADPENKLAEVEALGKILRSDKDSKCCTDKLKIVREISIAELLKDRAFCLKVIEREPDQVQFMEDQIQEVYLAAVEQDGWVLKYIPKNKRTIEICLEAIRQDRREIKNVPENIKTQEFYFTVVEQDGIMLHYVPDNIRTLKMCLAAVKQNGQALCYVPETMKTPEICLEAVKQNGLALKYIIEQTLEICMAAVQRDGRALKYVLKQTPEICGAAVWQYSSAIRYVQDDKLRAQLMDIRN